MRMVRPSINFELTKHRTPQGVLRQHAFYGDFQHAFRVICPHLFNCRAANASGVTRVTPVQLALLFITGNAHFFRVNDHDEVSGIYVRRKFWLVLTTQPASNLSCDTTKRFVLCVDDPPRPDNVPARAYLPFSCSASYLIYAAPGSTLAASPIVRTANHPGLAKFWVDDCLKGPPTYPKKRDANDSRALDALQQASGRGTQEISLNLAFMLQDATCASLKYASDCISKSLLCVRSNSKVSRWP